MAQPNHAIQRLWTETVAIATVTAHDNHRDPFGLRTVQQPAQYATHHDRPTPTGASARPATPPRTPRPRPPPRNTRPARHRPQPPRPLAVAPFPLPPSLRPPSLRPPDPTRTRSHLRNRGHHRRRRDRGGRPHRGPAPHRVGIRRLRVLQILGMWPGHIPGSHRGAGRHLHRRHEPIVAARITSWTTRRGRRRVLRPRTRSRPDTRGRAPRPGRWTAAGWPRPGPRSLAPPRPAPRSWCHPGRRPRVR
jgi:hypothetical protein